MINFRSNVETISKIESIISKYQPTTVDKYIVLKDSMKSRDRLRTFLDLAQFVFVILAGICLVVLLAFVAFQINLDFKTAGIAFVLFSILVGVLQVMLASLKTHAEKFYQHNNLIDMYYVQFPDLSASEMFQGINYESYMEIEYLTKEYPVLKAKVAEILKTQEYLTILDYHQLKIESLLEKGNCDALVKYKNSKVESILVNLK